VPRLFLSRNIERGHAPGRFREPLLVLASCAQPALLAALADCALESDSCSGAGEVLTAWILEAAQPRLTQDARLYEGALAVQAKARARSEGRVSIIMGPSLAHPSSIVREGVLAEMIELGVTGTVETLSSSIRKAHASRDWIQLISLMRSTMALRGSVGQPSMGDGASAGCLDALAEQVAELCIPSAESSVVCAAAQCLRRLRVVNPKITAALGTLLRAGHGSTLTDVSHTLARLGIDWVAIADILFSRMKQVDAAMQESSGTGQTKIVPRQAVQLFKGIVEALTSAGEHHADDVRAALMFALQNGSVEVACAAAKALGIDTELRRPGPLWLEFACVAPVRVPSVERTAGVLQAVWARRRLARGGLWSALRRGPR
jgi:hypothetical protein